MDNTLALKIAVRQVWTACNASTNVSEPSKKKAESSISSDDSGDGFNPMVETVHR